MFHYHVYESGLIPRFKTSTIKALFYLYLHILIRGNNSFKNSEKAQFPFAFTAEQPATNSTYGK